jgi:predicted metal-dependent hydrolase
VYYILGKNVLYKLLNTLKRSIRLFNEHQFDRSVALFGLEAVVEVSYRNGFVVGCPQAVSEAARDDLIEDALRLWFRKRLRQDVADLVRRHGEPNGLKPKDIQIKHQKHILGSCGLDRVVNLNWHLVFAPRTLLEYAVVHELCHLRHRTHDGAFWGLVATILPDWEARKAWLDHNEHFLTLRRVEPT